VPVPVHEDSRSFAGAAIVRTARAGRLFEEVEVPGVPGVRQIDVLDWVDGVHLGSVERGISTAVGSVEAAYRAIGELAARIHNQATEWRRLPAFMAARGTTYLGWVHSRRGEQATHDLAPQLIELAVSVAEEYLI